MNNLLQNLPHILVAACVIGAVSALAALGVISGGEALSAIAAVAGFSLGGSVANTSLSAVAGAMPAISSSSGGSTTTITPSAQHVPQVQSNAAPVPTTGG